MKKAALVFLPFPVMGHMVSAVEIAKLLVHSDDRLFITFLIMKPAVDSGVSNYIDSLTVSTGSNRFQFVNLPSSTVDRNSYGNSTDFFASVVESQKPHVREVASKLITQPQLSTDSPRLVGFVLDMLCTVMMDVAKEFGVPSYVFFAASAACLHCYFYLQALHDEQNVNPNELSDSDAELPIPSLANLLPARHVPALGFSKESLYLLAHIRRWRDSAGIIVNTFSELETHAVRSFSDGKSKFIPAVFPVGPILDTRGDFHFHDGSSNSFNHDEIMGWLDSQPPSSVVFLCFGSFGSFSVDQIREIACALEKSGHRFLWSLRQFPPTDKFGSPSDCGDPRDVLPEGFMDRSDGIGKIIGWAPQVKILAHPSVGGFVSHCGWNSILESLWFGVPIATWPLYAEQQFNAFELVVELGLAVEMKMDYRKEVYTDNEAILSAKEIERGIRSLMESDSGTRKKTKEMSDLSRKALMEGESSRSSLQRLVQDMVPHIP